MLEPEQVLRIMEAEVLPDHPSTDEVSDNASYHFFLLTETHHI